MSSATTSLEVPCNLCRADDVDVVYPAGRAQARAGLYDAESAG